jgi:hypothetical protein
MKTLAIYFLFFICLGYSFNLLGSSLISVHAIMLALFPQAYVRYL